MPLIRQGIGRALLKGGGVPPWVEPGTLLKLDFAGDRGWQNGITLPSSTSLITIIRASSGYDLPATTLFAANTVRRTSAGALFEPSRTNLYSKSRDITNAYWFKNGSSVTSDGTLNNDSSTAQKLVENSSNSGHYIDVGSGVGVTSGSTYTRSMLAKAGTRSWLACQIYDTGNNLSWFNLAGSGATGTVGSGYSATIGALSGGWLKTSITKVVAASTVYSGIQLATGNGVNGYQGDGVSGLYIDHQQLELGSYATSPIVATSSPATRNADNASLTLPSGTGHVDLVYFNIVTGVTATTTAAAAAGSYTIPNNPANSNLLSLRAYA